MPDDPTEPSPHHDDGPDRLDQLTPQALRRVTRRALLSIYTPQQTAIWLAAHAPGDPVEVARKAHRLCGIDGREPITPPSPQQTGSEPRSPGSREALGRVTRSLGGLHDAPAFLQRVLATARATLGSTSRIGITLDPQVARELLRPDDPLVLDPGRPPPAAPGAGDQPDAGRDVGTTGGRGVDDSSLVVPITGEAAVLGALHLYADSPEAFDVEDRAVAAILAAQAGVAISAFRNMERSITIDEEVHDRVQDVLMANGCDAEVSVDEVVMTASRRLLATTVGGSPGADDDGGRPDGDPPRVHLSELEVQEILLAAIRDIFTCEQPDEIQAVLLETIDRLGGRITRAADADERSIPVDLSLNLGEPLLVVPASGMPDVEDHLRAHLPRLVEDARHALDRVERSGRLASDAEHDALTGLFNRRAYDRFAGRLHPGDVLVLLDLDDFKVVNDTHGHLVGDQLLRVFGSVLRDHMRITEQAVRLGGDEFLIVLERPGEHGADLLLERLRVAWYQRRPLPVTFSSGVAVVTSGVDDALEAADRALYERKRIRARTVPSRWDRS